MSLARFGKWLVTGAIPLAIYGGAIFLFGKAYGYREGSRDMKVVVLCALEQTANDLPYENCERAGIKVDRKSSKSNPA